MQGSKPRNQWATCSLPQSSTFTYAILSMISSASPIHFLRCFFCLKNHAQNCSLCGKSNFIFSHSIEVQKTIPICRLPLPPTMYEEFVVETTVEISMAPVCFHEWAQTASGFLHLKIWTNGWSIFVSKGKQFHYVLKKYFSLPLLL